jgi:hypothetical protein
MGARREQWPDTPTYPKGRWALPSATSRSLLSRGVTDDLRWMW